MAAHQAINETTKTIAGFLWNSAPPEFLSSLSTLITLGKAVGIVFLIYLAFLIIKSIINIRQALRTKSIEQNVIEINKKLDLIIGKHHKKEDKREEKKK